MAFRNTTLVVLVIMVVLSILWITVIPIYIHGITNLGFFFPFFFFPFMRSGRRSSSKPNPNAAASNDDNSSNQYEFDYLNILENENSRRSFQARNYIFYFIAAVIFAIGIIIAFTRIL